MKTGKSIIDLATEIDRQAREKNDYIVAAHAMRLAETGSELNVDTVETDLPLTETGHAQLGAYTEIPARYYELMRSAAPDLLARNVNHWLARREKDDRRMVRVLDGKARAILSHKYKRLDNYEVADAVLPMLQTLDAKIVSSEITERRLYIKATSERLRGEVAKGDVVQGGVVITNSEVGAGALSIELLIHRLVCLNGMIMPNTFGGLRRAHLGKAITVQGAVAAIGYTSETEQAIDRAFWAQFREAAEQVLNPERFSGAVKVFAASKEDRVESGDPVGAVRKLSNTFRLSETETTGVMRHLVEGGELNRFGLVNAVTRYSQDVDSYDRATELEEIGGKILTLNRSDWKSISVATSQD